MRNKNYSLMIAGVGGQGTVLAAHIVAEVALEGGYKVKVAESYGGAMRGGDVYSLVRFGEAIESPMITEDSLDVLVGFEPIEALRQGVQFLSPTGEAIVNTVPIMSADINLGLSEYPGIERIVGSLQQLCRRVVAFDGTVAAKEAGSSRSLNIVMIGALAESKLLPISVETFEGAIAKRVPKGTEEANLKAFHAGRRAYQTLTEPSLRRLRKQSTAES
jgi:indolepyruvate ferredoxin oxidoreductase beta subunit